MLQWLCCAVFAIKRRREQDDESRTENSFHFSQKRKKNLLILRGLNFAQNLSCSRLFSAAAKLFYSFVFFPYLLSPSPFFLFVNIKSIKYQASRASILMNAESEEISMLRLYGVSASPARERPAEKKNSNKTSCLK